MIRATGLARPVALLLLAALSVLAGAVPGAAQQPQPAIEVSGIDTRA